MRSSRLRKTLVLAISLVAVWRCTRAPAREAPASVAAVRPAIPVQRVAPNAPSAPDDDGVLPSPERVSLIDDVALSSPAVCPDEPFTVTVRAHDPGGSDDGLYTFVGGHAVGNPVVLSYRVPGDQEVAVTVFSKRGPGLVDRRSATVRVRADCARGPGRLELGQRPLSRHLVGFTATLRGAPGGDPIASYRWDFGDGATARTERPFAEHDYERTRPTRAIQANLIARVSATTLSGRVLDGAIAVPFFNLYQKNKLEAGVLTPEAVVERIDRSPDAITVHTRVTNPETIALALRDVDAQAIPCAGDDEAATIQYPAAAVLDGDALEPGEHPLSATLRLASLPAGTCRVLLIARGSSPAGEAVALQIPVILAEPAPTRLLEDDTADPDERRLLQRIADARRVLARTGPDDAVSQDEIDWLIKQGRID